VLPGTAIEPLETRRRSFRVALVCDGLQWSAVVYSGVQQSARGAQIVRAGPSKSRRAPSSTLGPDTSARSARCGGMGEEACQGESGPFDWNARTRRRNSSMHPLSSPPRSTSAWPGETSGERGENVVALLNGSHSGMIAFACG
jgi:hypothetical protein